MSSAQAWVAPAAKKKFVRQEIDLGPLAPDDVEVAVENCGLCHSDLSVWHNDWGGSTYPAVLGHEVIGRVTAVGSAAKDVHLPRMRWHPGTLRGALRCPALS